MKPKNIKEFKALVERYESITFKEVNNKWQTNDTEGESLGTKYIGHYNAGILTGFGDMETCSLCLACEGICGYCVYGKEIELLPVACNDDTNHESYNGISTAQTPKELLKAFRARAKHLRKTYPQYL